MNIWRQFKINLVTKKLLKYYMQTLCLISHTKYMYFPLCGLTILHSVECPDFEHQIITEMPQKSQSLTTVHQANTGHKILGD